MERVTPELVRCTDCGQTRRKQDVTVNTKLCKVCRNRIRLGKLSAEHEQLGGEVQQLAHKNQEMLAQIRQLQNEKSSLKMQANTLSRRMMEVECINKQLQQSVDFKLRTTDKGKRYLNWRSAMQG